MITTIRTSLILIIAFILSACSQTFENQQLLGRTFPSVNAESLSKQQLELPNYFSGRPVVLLLGYKQNSQFDIDRWLIGLDMTKTAVDIYELPTIQGWAPRLIKSSINEGMRKGIPQEIWSIVLTIYQDGEIVQRFTGNQNPNNARVMLLNPEGTITFFHDRGFSVAALNQLRETLMNTNE